jgi:hypothetical protein
MDIKVCANLPCGEKFTSSGKFCEECNTKAKREEQIKQNKIIVEERNLKTNK